MTCIVLAMCWAIRPLLIDELVDQKKSPHLFQVCSYQLLKTCFWSFKVFFMYHSPFSPDAFLKQYLLQA